MFLWESIAFGPIRSRRLGSSLGINVCPTDVKICSFDCVYCECGWTLEKNVHADCYPPAEVVLQAIEQKLQQCRQDAVHIDSITFSGNGEPTLHPAFGEIIDKLLVIRDKYYPNAIITCLSNATMLQNGQVRSALLEIENPMLKLDAALSELFTLINRPTIPVTLENVLEGLRAFKGNFLMQTLFLKGVMDGQSVDNTTEENVSAWLQIVAELKPRSVVLYSLDRETPAQELIKVYRDELEQIANKVRALGIEAKVFE